MKRSPRSWGRLLVLLGVFAWLPYVTLKYLLSEEVPLTPFLIVHLLGVIPGAFLARGEELLQLLRQNKSK